MPRKYAQTNTSLSGDPKWRALNPLAQNLYLTLWNAPKLSYCGVHEWRPGRLASLSTGLTRGDMEIIAASLEARHFLVIDRDTEEALIRSWIQWDGLMKQPRMAVSCVMAYAEVSSNTLRQVLVHELSKVRSEHPDLACWRHEKVREVLAHPSVSAKDLPVPPDPFTPAFALSLTHSFTPGLTPSDGETSLDVSTPPTPTPTPTPNSFSPGASRRVAPDGAPRKSRRKPEKPLPDDWKPTARHTELALELGVSLPSEAMAFRDHAATHDRRCADWDAAFRNWLRKAKPEPTAQPSTWAKATLVRAEDIR